MCILIWSFAISKPTTSTCMELGYDTNKLLVMRNSHTSSLALRLLTPVLNLECSTPMLRVIDGCLFTSPLIWFPHDIFKKPLQRVYCNPSRA